MLLVNVAIFVVAFAGVVGFTILALRLTGRATARREPRRRLMAALAALCALGVPASAAAGFIGMAAVQFYATRG